MCKPVSSFCLKAKKTFLNKKYVLGQTDTYFSRKCGELLVLKSIHIDSKRNIVVLKNAKGQKDRIVHLSPKMIEMLRNYYKIFRPTTYLFEGQTGGMTYDSRSLQ
jgi:integrase